MIVLLLWLGGLIGLTAAFTTGFWWTVLFWIELQFMHLEAEEYDEAR
jgi:hypothetical protein